MKLFYWALSLFGLERITEEDWEKGRVAIQEEKERELRRRNAQE